MNKAQNRNGIFLIISVTLLLGSLRWCLSWPSEYYNTCTGEAVTPGGGWSAVWPLLGSSNNVYRPQLSPVSSRRCFAAATPHLPRTWLGPCQDMKEVSVLSIYIINSTETVQLLSKWLLSMMMLWYGEGDTTQF